MKRLDWDNHEKMDGREKEAVVRAEGGQIERNFYYLTYIV